MKTATFTHLAGKLSQGMPAQAPFEQGHINQNISRTGCLTRACLLRQLTRSDFKP